MMMVLAHRGASSYAPENTMAAFYKAIELGANGIEIDLRRTKDDHIIIFHDNELDRTTNGTGKVKDLNLMEIKQLDAGSWFAPKYTGEKIVTFTNFMYYFSMKPIYLAIELKDQYIEKSVLSIINDYHAKPELITITSFDFSNLERMRQASRTIRLGYLTDNVTDENIYKIKEINAQQLCVDVTTLQKEDVHLAKSHQIEVRTWNTKNESLMKHAIECGVDGMTLNFPDKLVNLVK